MTVMVNEKLNAAADGIEAAIRRSTVGIVVGSGEQKRQGIGTGTLVCWNGHYLILTAAHVIEGTQLEDIRIFFCPDVPHQTLKREELLSLSRVLVTALWPFANLTLGRVVSDPELDLAAIEVDSSSLDKSSLDRFSSLVEGGRTPAEDQQAIVIGFPYDISRLTQENNRIVFTQVIWTRVTHNRGHLLKNFDPTKHFLAPYDQETPDARPYGISGAGMWIQVKSGSAVWRPNIDLVGVATNWYEAPNLMKTVRREEVERFLIEKVTW